MKRTIYFSEDLAAKCRELREQRGLTLDELALQLDPPTSRQYISNAERDTDPKRDGIRLKIIKHLTGKRAKAGYVLLEPGEEG